MIHGSTNTVSSGYLALAIRNYTLQRKVIDGNEKAPATTGDVEKGTAGNATPHSQEDADNAEKRVSQTPSAEDIKDPSTVKEQV